MTNGYDAALKAQKYKKQIESMAGMKEKNELIVGFGEEVWEWIKDMCRQDMLFDSEEAEALMEIAERHGLAKRVKYIEKLHGEMDCDEGDEIWYWGDKR